MARRPKKTIAGMNFVGEQIRAGKVITIDDVRQAVNMGPAQAHRVVKHFRDLGVLTQVKRGRYATKAVAKSLGITA